MKKKSFLTPMFETKINKAVFLQQDLIVYLDNHKRVPNDIVAVIKFLFGESACVTIDKTDEFPKLIIEGANYMLQNVRTINADWTFQEVEQ